MPSRNKSILRHHKALLVGTIIDREHVHVGPIIAEEMLMRVRQETTLLPFLVLITQLYESASFHFQAATNVKATPASSSYILRVEAKFLRDNVAWKKPPPPESTPVVNLATLDPKTITPSLSMEQASISSPSSIAVSFIDASV